MTVRIIFLDMNYKCNQHKFYYMEVEVLELNAFGGSCSSSLLDSSQDISL